MQDQDGPEISFTRDQHAWRTRFFTRIQRFRTLLGAKWWIIVLAVVAGLAVQGVRWFLEKPSYLSFGRMIVNVKLSIPEGSLYTEELSNFLGTQSALMQSGVVVNRAHSRALTQFTNASPDEVELKVSILPKTTIFVLQAIGKHEGYASVFLQSVMEEYVKLKQEMRIQTSDTTLAGLTEEVLRLQKELKKADDELTAFQSSNSVVLLQEQGNNAVSYLATLNQRLAMLRSEHALLQSLTLEQNLERKQQPAGATTASDLLSSGDAAKTDYFRAKQQIMLLKAERDDMAELLKPKHPKMIAMSEEIERRERLLEIFRQQSGEQLESSKNSLALQIERLEQDVKEWDAKSLDLSVKTAEHARLKANSQRIQALYDRLLGMMQTLDVNKEISPESVTIMEKASPAMPQKASLWIQLLIGAIAGLVLSMGLLLVLDRLDDRMSSFTELRDLFEEEVLAQIPREKVADRNGMPLISQAETSHPFVEAYRNLRSSLLYMENTGNHPKTLLVTSSVPNEGKSVTAENLAAMLATSGSRVLLLDADVRKGALHAAFGVPSEPGLTEVLSSAVSLVEAVQATRVPNLWILSRGGVSHRGSELFVSAVTRALLKQAATDYDYVIIDTAPVMAADDVTSLAPQADATIFVIRAEQTSARVARAALDLLYQRRVNVIGIVFNAVRPASADYYYYKYHDYYGKHAERTNDTPRPEKHPA